MKLSELVAYKTSLDQYDFVRSSKSLVKKINESQTDIEGAKGADSNIRFGDGVYKEQLANDLTMLQNQINNLQNNYSYYRDQVNKLILDQEHEYLSRCEKQFVSRVLGEDMKAVQNRRLSLTNNQKKQFISRINLYVDWRWPGLIIRPEDQDIVESMCAFDPLYLADIYQELLDPYIKKFNPVYQNRLRPYQLSKFIPRKKTLDVLPQQQFGFVTAYNLIDHYPLYMIKQILIEVEKLLKPGGVFLFTFNNCDLARNIATFEKGQRSYTPWRLLQPIIEDLGFKITQKQTQEHNWCEIRKPGKLKSIRGGQAIAKIFNDTATPRFKKYTADEKERIYREAIALKIDSESAIRAGGISIAKLELAILRKKEHQRVEEIKKTLGERIFWSASNKGYLKGQHISFNGKNYIALVDIQPKQKFEDKEWELVE